MIIKVQDSTANDNPTKNYYDGQKKIDKIFSAQFKFVGDLRYVISFAHYSHRRTNRRTNT